MELKKIQYKNLNARQKENYNYHKIASALAEYGYDCMRLNNDWEGADFIAVKDDEMLKIQLKGRFTIDKKYWNKEIYIAFRENNENKIYKHDVAVNMIPENTAKSKSWAENGLYSWGKTPEFYNDIITIV
tara:strand:+ start:200 stop:589 length:390 start_codon:yes stop_codon:yes gene_type:complete